MGPSPRTRLHVRRPTLRSRPAAYAPLYTPAERARRDATPWTLVQAVLAPIQFVVFAVSLVLFVVTMMSAAIPANRAASIQPVDALRID